LSCRLNYITAALFDDFENVIRDLILRPKDFEKTDEIGKLPRKEKNSEKMQPAHYFLKFWESKLVIFPVKAAITVLSLSLSLFPV